MHISMRVPYDEERQRRVLKFVLRPQLRPVRIGGVVLVLLGVVLLVLSPTNIVAYGVVALGLLFLFVVGRISVAMAVRGQAAATKTETHLTLDDEWLTAVTPVAESRFRWSVVDRIVDTPDAWYLTLGRYQAVMLAKELMTEEQRAEFAAFVGGMSPTKP
jgi:hypothetical protein